MEDQFNNFQPPQQSKKGNSILIPSLIFAVVLFVIGLILYKWQGKEEVLPVKEEIAITTTTNTGVVETVSEPNKEYEQLVAVNIELTKQLEEMQKQINSLSTPTEGSTQSNSSSEQTVTSNVEVIAKAKEQGVIADVQVINRDLLGVTTNIFKEKFSVQSKQLATIKDSKLGATDYNTMYILRLVNEKGLVLPMFTNYTTYTSVEVGTPLTVDYLKFEVNGRPIYDISKVEK